MKVILLADVRGLGKKSEVKEVSDGHARNFLFPRGLAKTASAEDLRQLQARQAAAAKEDETLHKHLEELARVINDRFVEFEMKTDGHGSVFGSVTKDMILKAMREHGLLGKERADLELEHPLKTLGEHRVGVDLKKGVQAALKVVLKAA